MKLNRLLILIAILVGMIFLSVEFRKDLFLSLHLACCSCINSKPTDTHHLSEIQSLDSDDSSHILEDDDSNSIEQAAPRLDRGLPRLGRGSPRLGRGSPRLGRGSPRLGRGSPRLGRGSPRLGRGSPRLGRGSPRLGRGSPRLGRRAAAMLISRFNHAGRYYDDDDDEIIDYQYPSEPLTNEKRALPRLGRAIKTNEQ